MVSKAIELTSVVRGRGRHIVDSCENVLRSIKMKKETGEMGKRVESLSKVDDIISPIF